MVNSQFQKCLIGLALICPILLLPSLVHVDSARAADCTAKACIDVYIQDGQIVIEGRKGSGPSERPVLKVVPRVTKRPTPKAVPKTMPKTPRKAVFKAPAPRKRVVRKVVTKVAASVSLNDRLVKLIPTGNISHEPSANAIVNIPIIYWCDLPSAFSTKVAIVGEVVDVAMRPAFLWSFGDGTFFATTSPGAGYPDQVISHTYSKAGTYVVVMSATWGGTWSNNGVARAITGEIRKISTATVTVANAPTRVTK